MPDALDGLRVLDLGRFIGAPWAGVLFADMGAEVIRIERPGGEEDRYTGLRALDDQSMVYHVSNVNKKSVTLDIRCDRGKEILRKLISVSDILLENFSPGGAEVMGISYSLANSIKPDIIYVSVSGFGHSGPYANRLAFDPIGKAMSGSMSITGFPGTPPVRDGSAWVDMMTATNAAVGALAALHHRDKTGEGQHVEVALADSALAAASRVFADYITRGIVRTQMGNQSLYTSQNAYQTRDGWVFIATIQAIWGRFCRLIGRPELKDDPLFKTDALRFENRDALDAIIGAWAKERTNAEMGPLLESARVPFGPVYNGPQVAADPHFRAREMIVEFEYSRGKFPGKKVAVPGLPIKLSKTPGKVKTIAPDLGENNDEIYGGLLGYPKDELAELRNAGVI